jgi:hypothetical protein
MILSGGYRVLIAEETSALLSFGEHPGISTIIGLLERWSRNRHKLKEVSWSSCPPRWRQEMAIMLRSPGSGVNPTCVFFVISLTPALFVYTILEWLQMRMHSNSPYNFVAPVRWRGKRGPGHSWLFLLRGTGRYTQDSDMEWCIVHSHAVILAPSSSHPCTSHDDDIRMCMAYV